MMRCTLNSILLTSREEIAKFYARKQCNFINTFIVNHVKYITTYSRHETYVKLNLNHKKCHKYVVPKGTRY